jgi:hypothetical protein
MSLGLFLFGDNGVDITLHEKVSFGNIVPFAGKNFTESPDGFGQGDVFARNAGKDFCDMDGLGEEFLDFTGAANNQLVFFREFVHAEDGDHILKIFVALEDLLYAARHAIVLFSDDFRRKSGRGGC